MVRNPASDPTLPGFASLQDKISSGTFTTDGKYFAEVRAGTDRDSQMIVWIINDGTSISSVLLLSGIDGPHVAWSADSTQVAVPSIDRRIVVLRVN
jgi:hypothetical protein